LSDGHGAGGVELAPWTHLLTYLLNRKSKVKLECGTNPTNGNTGAS